MPSPRVTVAVLLLALASACDPGPPADAQDARRGDTASTGRVEVTNRPLAWVVERLAGSLVEVDFRAAAADDPASWRPTAEQVLAMQSADLVLLNGAGHEGWLAEVSLPAARVVDTTAAVSDRLIALEGIVTHSHGAAGAHTHGGTAFTTWLDPTLLAEQARAAAGALERTWPEHAELFAERLAALEAELASVDAELAAATAGAADQPVLFSHPVYQYLARRYGLLGESVHWEPGEAPDEAAWGQLEGLLQRRPAAWMLWEAEPLPQTAERLARMGVRCAVVDPCSAPDTGDVADVMRRNAAALRAVFGGG